MTERLHREVLETQKRLEGIVESAMDAIITIDERQKIILFNPAAEQMFGVSREDALGQPIERFIPHRFRAGHDEHIRRFRQTGVTGRRMGALGAVSGLRADGEEFPLEASISQVEVEGERLATVILRDITERIANESARLLLAREIDHRAKNALAVVQALVSQTTAPTIEDFVVAVRGRVGALGRAHSLLAQNRWQGGDMGKIIADEIEPYHRPGQFRVRGERVVLSPSAVQPFSLLVHELATNALKHGALSVPTGLVQVTWSVMADGDLRLEWSESGGPPFSDKRTDGFGMTLMSTVLRQLGGKLTIHWDSDALEVAAQLPKIHCRAMTDSENATATGAKENEAPQQEPCRVLIVEDELLVGMEMASALGAEGWEVLGPVGTLEEAFAILSKDVSVDAAVLDINLNGQLVYPVADLLRIKKIPYLFCTGYEAPDSDKRYGQYPIIHKPANLRILIEEVRNLCCGISPDPDKRRAA